MADSNLTSSPGQTQYLSSRGGENTPPQDPLLGQILGSFKILSLLGLGGMGRVYVAEHTLIGRRAAIKVLAAEIATHPDLVSRFFTEARAVNDIRHPNIVEVTDFGVFGEQPYIVMELLDGETLEQRLSRVGRLDEATAVRVGAQVAAAVGAGHEHEMVHRDLKPANIFLRNHPDYPDFVKVLDFGIAKLVAHDRQVSHHTQIGALIGTPAYMSPEQCLGDVHLDHRSDIYSLGIVLFQLVTGRLPFQAETAGRLIMCHVQEKPPSPQSLRPDISLALAACILRAIEKKPEQRFPSMRDFREALLAASSGAQVTAPGIVSPNMSTGALAQLLTPPPAPMAAPTEAKAPIVPPSPLKGLPSQPTQALFSARDMESYPPPAALPVAAAPLPRAPLFPAPPVPPPAARAPLFAPLPAIPASPPPAPAQIGTHPGTADSQSMTGSGKADLVDRVAELVRGRISSDLDFSLPVLPKGVLRCLDLLNSPDFSFGGMSVLLSNDLRLAGQMIQAANTSGTSRNPARNAEQAVARMGAEGTRTALFEVAIRPILESPLPRLQAVFKQPYTHSLAVAYLAQRLVQKQGGSEEQAILAYRSGLYHDAGRPLIAPVLLDIERQLSDGKGRRLFGEDMFAAILDRTFAPASAKLARAFGLSREIAQGIEDFMKPMRPGLHLASVLRLANALAHMAGYHTRRDELDKARLAVEEAREAAGVDAETCHRALDGMKDAVQRRL